MNQDAPETPEHADSEPGNPNSRHWKRRVMRGLWGLAGLLAVWVFVLPTVMRWVNPPQPAGEQVAELIERMTSPEMTKGERLIAAGNLSGMGRAAVTPLLEVIRNAEADYNSAILAVGALRTIGNEATDTMPELLVMLDDENPFIVRSASRVLGGMGPQGTSAADALARLLDHPDLRVRQTAVEALGDIGVFPDSGILPLIRLLQVPDPKARMFALRAIHLLPVDDAQVQDAIFELLNAPDAEVRRHAHDVWWDIEAARLGFKQKQRPSEEAAVSESTEL